MTISYVKPWLPVSEQIEKLKSYGLVVNDEQAASDFLKHLNYYRFSGYGVAFEKTRHVFHPGTTFEAVCDAYYFDRTLRDWVTESLEVIELDMRSAIVFAGTWRTGSRNGNWICMRIAPVATHGGPISSVYCFPLWPTS